MGYPRIPEIEKAERARRRRQEIGGRKVSRYAWSPYTAQPRRFYTFYADCVLAKPLYLPAPIDRGEKEPILPLEGKVPYEPATITVEVFTGTFLEFTSFVLSGGAWNRCQDVCAGYGGTLVSIEGYWRMNHKGMEKIAEGVWRKAK